MPVETVFNTSPAKESSGPRRRSGETGATGDGKGFSLPKQEATTAQDGGQDATRDGKPASAPRQPATAAAAKAAGQDKPVTTARPQTSPAPAGSFVDTLAELLAAAQEQAASSAGDTTDGAGAKGKPGQKGTDGKKAGEASADRAEATDTAVADKISGEVAALVVSPDQKTTGQQIAGALSLALPVATSAGGKNPGEDAVAEGGAIPPGQASKGQILAASALAARAGHTEQAGTSVGKPADGSAPAATPTAITGEHSPTTAQAHKGTTLDTAADATVSSMKTDAAPGISSGQGASATPGEAKPAEVVVQQALAPIDLGALVQQAVGGADSARLLSPLDQATAAANQAPSPGQGQTGLPPTSLHVLPVEIGLRALSGSKQFDIRLDPDELGRVDVNLSISDKGEVSARLVVDRVETLHLLQRDARTLERAFEQAGLKPSDSGVDISLRDPSDQSAFRQQRQHEEAPQRPRQPSLAETGDDAVLQTNPVPQRRLVRLGGVDLSI